MTLDGTNTWLIAEPGSATAIVVDPGPGDEAHLRRVLDTAGQRGQRITAIVLTHRHLDHSEGAPRLAELTGAPVRAVDPEHRLGSEGLTAGDVLTDGGCELRVIATPGHTTDSVCLFLPADGAVLTGDTVLGRGTTVIGTDGSLTDYLGSLHRLRALVEESGVAVAAARARAAAAGRRPGRSTTTSPTGRSGSPRCRRRSPRATGRWPRSSPGSTRRWTRGSGRSPSGRCERSWSTWTPEASCRPGWRYHPFPQER